MATIKLSSAQISIIELLLKGKGQNKKYIVRASYVPGNCCMFSHREQFRTLPISLFDSLVKLKIIIPIGKELPDKLKYQLKDEEGWRKTLKIKP